MRLASSLAIVIAAVVAVAAGGCGGKREGRAEPAKGAGELKAPPPTKGPALPPPPIEPPSNAECDRAIANMKSFMPEDVPGDADDKSQCMAMPRPVVVCLQTAKTEADVDGCVERYAAQQGAAPAPPPEARAGEADCQEAMSNVRTLVPDMTGDPAQLVKDCVAMASAAEVKCLLDARSKDDLAKCEGLDD